MLSATLFITSRLSQLVRNRFLFSWYAASKFARQIQKMPDMQHGFLLVATALAADRDPAAYIPPAGDRAFLLCVEQLRVQLLFQLQMCSADGRVIL